jgi:hypothetical protein
MPWFRVYVRGIDQGHSWLATNEAEVLQKFIRNKANDLKEDAKKSGLDEVQYRKAHIRIIRE